MLLVHILFVTAGLAQANAGNYAKRVCDMFWRRNRNREMEQMRRAMSRLADKMADLEQQMKNRQPIYIETVHVHNPRLDQLSFSLDRMEIEELSGSLNLGNNFGVDAALHPDRPNSRETNDRTANGRTANGRATNDRATNGAQAPGTGAHREAGLRSGGNGGMRQTSKGYSYKF